MTPYSVFAWCIVAAVAAAVLPYIVGRFAIRRRRLEYRVRSKARWGGLTIDTAARQTAHEDAKSEVTKTYPPMGGRLVGKHPALAAPYGNRNRISLTPRQLETVNIRRKLAGKTPLNTRGFRGAVANAATERNQPRTSDEWLTYLILYEAFFSDHTTYRTSVDTGVQIDPSTPFNGQGGEFAGAGASGDWTSVHAQSLAAASLTTAAAVTAAGGDPLSNPNSPIGPGGVDLTMPGGDGGYPQSQPSDPASSGPGPSYSAPDPSPSYTDTSSSYSPSFDSSPAPDTSSSF